jgi:hypothetical protein
MSNRSPLLATIPNYERECDNSPEMAELRREYIFAAAEIIAGIVLWEYYGVWIVVEGCNRALGVLNKRITLFHIAKKDHLKSIEKISESTKDLKK